MSARAPRVPNPGPSTVMALRIGATTQATDPDILAASQHNPQLPQAASRLLDDWR